MLIITKEGIKALVERMSDPKRIDQCREELKRMVEIKQSHAWRAEDGRSRCYLPWTFVARLDWEARVLEKALAALDDGDRRGAMAMLEEYVSQLEPSSTK